MKYRKNIGNSEFQVFGLVGFFCFVFFLIFIFFFQIWQTILKPQSIYTKVCLFPHAVTSIKKTPNLCLCTFTYICMCINRHYISLKLNQIRFNTSFKNLVMFFSFYDPKWLQLLLSSDLMKCIETLFLHLDHQPCQVPKLKSKTEN